MAMNFSLRRRKRHDIAEEDDGHLARRGLKLPLNRFPQRQALFGFAQAGRREMKGYSPSHLFHRPPPGEAEFETPRQFRALCGRLSVGKGFVELRAEMVGAAMCTAW